jgi:quinol monooxygenase YgiN
VYVNYVDWHTHPFRSERWLEVWRSALDRALAFGASSCYLTRDIDDPLHFRQVSIWENKDDFERYWFSDEIAALREQVFQYYNKPVIPSWHTVTAEATAGGVGGEETAAEQAPEEQRAREEQGAVEAATTE